LKSEFVLTFKDKMASFNGKNGKDAGKNDVKVSAKKPYIKINHEKTRDTIISNLSVFGEPIFDKCPKKDENGNPVFKNGNPVYSYYVKGLWSLKTGEIHTIMISQSTMSYYDANTTNMYTFKINFEDKCEKDIKTLLDGKTIFGVTLKYIEKIDPRDNAFVHRSVSFIAKIHDMFNQTSMIAGKINEILSGQITSEQVAAASVPAKVILKKENFPALTSKANPFTPAASASVSAPAAPVAAAPAPAAAPATAPAVATVKTEVRSNDETTTLSEILNSIETERTKINDLSMEETELKNKIDSSDSEMEQFKIDMKLKLEEGIKKIQEIKEKNNKRLEIIKEEKSSSITKNENLTKIMIEKLSNSNSWANM
jgi:hypothetical protein